MTDTTNNNKSARKPSHVAYSVREREGKEAKWTEIGVVFSHRDGKGFDILCDVLPLSGRITIRAQEQK